MQKKHDVHFSARIKKDDRQRYSIGIPVRSFFFDMSVVHALGQGKKERFIINHCDSSCHGADKTGERNPKFATIQYPATVSARLKRSWNMRGKTQWRILESSRCEIGAIDKGSP